MKSVSNEINEYLNTEKNFETCDLYVLSLKSGNTYYIADYDVDVVYSGHTWTHKLMLLSREQIKLQGQPTVDTLNVTIKCDINDKIDNLPFMQACHSGLLDDASITLYKAYFKNGNIVGAYRFFQGFTEVSSAGGLVIKLTVKSKIQGLSQNVPTRVFAPQSAYTSNSAGNIVSSSTDSYSMLIPLKPSAKVLVKT